MTEQLRRLGAVMLARRTAAKEVSSREVVVARQPSVGEFGITISVHPSWGATGDGMRRKRYIVVYSGEDVPGPPPRCMVCLTQTRDGTVASLGTPKGWRAYSRCERPADWATSYYGIDFMCEPCRERLRQQEIEKGVSYSIRYMEQELFHAKCVYDWARYSPGYGPRPSDDRRRMNIPWRSPKRPTRCDLCENLYWLKHERSALGERAFTERREQMTFEGPTRRETRDRWKRGWRADGPETKRGWSGPPGPPNTVRPIRASAEELADPKKFVDPRKALKLVDPKLAEPCMCPGCWFAGDCPACGGSGVVTETYRTGGGWVSETTETVYPTGTAYDYGQRTPPSPRTVTVPAHYESETWHDSRHKCSACNGAGKCVGCGGKGWVAAPADAAEDLVAALQILERFLNMLQDIGARFTAPQSCKVTHPHVEVVLPRSAEDSPDETSAEMNRLVDSLGRRAEISDTWKGAISGMQTYAEACLEALARALGKEPVYPDRQRKRGARLA